MPLVVLSGQPCSGKSTVAAKLAALLGEAAAPVALVDEPSLHVERNSGYQTSAQEKATRGALKSAVERCISKKAVVVLDSINSIKGYRYELWCVARAAATRYCVVHVATPADTCAAWNAARPEEQRYSDAVFKDLAGRFETPDARNRWDAPLFTVHPGAANEDAVLSAVVAAMVDAPKQQRPPQQPQQPQQQQQGAAADGGDELQPEPEPLHQGARVTDLTPTLATSNPSLLATNVLHEIDRAVQAVVASVTEAQQLGPCAVVDLGLAGRLHLDRLVPLAELRRHKRSFLKLATKLTGSRVQDPAVAQRLFADYLRGQLALGGPG